jgi:hypothetical protein
VRRRGYILIKICIGTLFLHIVNFFLQVNLQVLSFYNPLLPLSQPAHLSVHFNSCSELPDGRKFGDIRETHICLTLKVVGNEKNGGSGRSQMLRYGAGHAVLE